MTTESAIRYRSAPCAANVSNCYATPRSVLFRLPAKGPRLGPGSRIGSQAVASASSKLHTTSHGIPSQSTGGRTPNGERWTSHNPSTPSTPDTSQLNKVAGPWFSYIGTPTSDRFCPWSAVWTQKPAAVAAGGTHRTATAVTKRATQTRALRGAGTSISESVMRKVLDALSRRARRRDSRRDLGIGRAAHRCVFG